jgi:MYXO-CTERM domain-containing protein
MASCQLEALFLHRRQSSQSARYALPAFRARCLAPPSPPVYNCPTCRPTMPAPSAPRSHAPGDGSLLSPCCSPLPAATRPMPASIRTCLPPMPRQTTLSPSNDVSAEDCPTAAADGGPLFNRGASEDSGCVCSTNQHDRRDAAWWGAFAAGAIALIRRRRRDP